MAHRRGVLTAASLMIAGPAAADAIAIARRLPSLRVGLHLVLLDGEPVLPSQAIPGLVGPDGRLRCDMVRLGIDLGLRPSLMRQCRKELSAQLDAFRRTGLALDHVNAHKHFHVHPMVAHMLVREMHVRRIQSLRVPCEPIAVLRRVEPGMRSAWTSVDPWAALLKAQARRSGLFVADAVFGTRWSGAFGRRRLSGLIEGLPPGTSEIYLHPATRQGFPGGGRGYRHNAELAALCDESVIAAVRRSHCSIGGYSDAPSRAASSRGSREPSGSRYRDHVDPTL
jgi:hopanoid biosynthesis associated protein HpnK